MIFTPDNTSRPTLVFLNGKPIKGCFYVDTRRGIARVYLFPLRIHKHGKRALSKTLSGVVTVGA